MKKQFNHVSGIFGENTATLYLRNHKYKILERNYSTKIGEIDIVAEKNNIIVFIEVKMRETCAFGRPSEAVNTFKQAKIRRVAEEYLIRNRLTDSQIRFDVIEVIGQDVNHIENAF